MPDTPINVDNVDRAAADSELVMTLEHYMSEWSSLLATVMQRESEKQPQGQGPLAEIEFWRARNAVLSSIFEQLNLPNVRSCMRRCARGEAWLNVGKMSKTWTGCNLHRKYSVMTFMLKGISFQIITKS
jgi:hypothetical protein